MFVSYILICAAYKSSYQEIIDLTKASALKFKTFSNQFLNDKNNHVKLPGNYHEKNVYYKVQSPVFATDSIIVKGLHIENDLLGIIPTNYDYFDNISKSFIVIDRKLQQIYKMDKFIEKSDGVYIFSIKNEDITSAFGIKCVDLTTKKTEKVLKEVGLKFIFEINFDISTKTNIISMSVSLNYDTNGEKDYSLDNIKEFAYPKNNSLGEKWNKVLSHLLLGMKLDFEIKISGFLDGTIEITTNFIGGVGFNIEFEKFVEDIIHSKRWEIFTIPYVPMDSVEIYGVKLGMELGFKFETFFESLKLTLPTIRVIGGLYYKSVIAMNYNIKSTSVISNFRILNTSPQILKDVPSISELYEAISLTFTIKPSVIPFYIKLDLPGIHTEWNMRVNIPFIFDFHGNLSCTKFVDFSLDYRVNLGSEFQLHVPILFPNVTDNVDFDIIQRTNLLKMCITDYTKEFKEELLKNAKDRDDFKKNETEIPYQKFVYETSKLAGTNFTCEFTEPYEDGEIDVEVSLLDIVITSRIIFKIENGYILPGYSNTKLKDEDIYIGKTFSSFVIYGNPTKYYYRIKFKRYKQQNVVFHFFNIYSMNDDSGDYFCPKLYAIDNTSSIHADACIGTKTTPTMIQCCNDCTHNLCYDDLEKEYFSKKYYFLKRTKSFYNVGHHPYWLPRYHLFPDNIESFVIPANEFIYVPIVKCDRCDSVQFIINNTIYNSKYFGKTKLFSPIIPTNGYDYCDDIKNMKVSELNTLKGITNQDIKVIAICNDNDKSYCYSKCIEPEGYSVIEMKDPNGINIYSGNISIEAPENIYERGSKYQVINNDDVPKNSFCSKSWDGKIDVVPNLSSDKMTLSIVNLNNTVKTIKAYLGKIFIPFSRTKLFADTKKFLEKIGISFHEPGNAVILEEDSNIPDDFHVILNYDGSIQVNTKYFNESNIKIADDNFDIPSSYAKSINIIHEEFDITETISETKYIDTKYSETEQIGNKDVEETKRKSNKSVIIIVCCIVVAIIIAIIIVLLIKFKNKIFGNLKTVNNDNTIDLSLIEN